MRSSLQIGIRGLLTLGYCISTEAGRRGAIFPDVPFQRDGVQVLEKDLPESQSYRKSFLVSERLLIHLKEMKQ